MGIVRNWQRRKILAQPFPDHWEKILIGDVPCFARLTPADRKTLRKHIQIFIAEKSFEGGGGLIITDAMRVTIAAYASLLLLNTNFDYYPLLSSIIVYPNSFAAQVQVADIAGIVTEGIEERLGESWEEGTVVLSWDSIREVIEGRNRGLNVILHEFAHQLDAVKGISSGRCSTHPDRWADICKATYTRMRSDRRRGRPQVLDRYGAISPEEFFAVTTEAFFEQPIRLKAHHIDIYNELRGLYRQDPARLTQPQCDTLSDQESMS